MGTPRHPLASPISAHLAAETPGPETLPPPPLHCPQPAASWSNHRLTGHEGGQSPSLVDCPCGATYELHPGEHDRHKPECALTLRYERLWRPCPHCEALLPPAFTGDTHTCLPDGGVHSGYCGTRKNPYLLCLCTNYDITAALEHHARCPANPATNPTPSKCLCQHMRLCENCEQWRWPDSRHLCHMPWRHPIRKLRTLPTYLRSLKTTRTVNQRTGRAIKYTDAHSLEYTNDPTLRYYVTRNKAASTVSSVARITAIGTATTSGALLATGSPAWATATIAATAILELAKRALSRAEKITATEIDNYLEHQYHDQPDFAHRR